MSSKMNTYGKSYGAKFYAHGCTEKFSHMNKARE
jgi:hypothetical protein